MSGAYKPLKCVTSFTSDGGCIHCGQDLVDLPRDEPWPLCSVTDLEARERNQREADAADEQYMLEQEYDA